MNRFHRLTALLVICCLSSCGEKRLTPKINKVPVVPVKGSVKVDGKPEANVVVRCVPLGDFQPKDLTNALGGRTNEDGEYTLGTYEVDDGVPPAEYALLFLWPEMALKKSSRTDEAKHDRLKGKYSKLENPALKIKVESDKPLVLDELDLKTK
jgi:hypothetical protein